LYVRHGTVVRIPLPYDPSAGSIPELRPQGKAAPAQAPGRIDATQLGHHTGADHHLPASTVHDDQTRLPSCDDRTLCGAGRDGVASSEVNYRRQVVLGPECATYEGGSEAGAFDSSGSMLASGVPLTSMATGSARTAVRQAPLGTNEPAKGCSRQWPAVRISRRICTP